MEIARIDPDDWRELKSIRLEALLREPAAFSSTYAESVTKPEEYWRQRLASPHSMTYVARTERGPIGLAGAHLGADGETHAAMLFGMYVSAAHRRQGVGRRLLRAVVAEVSAQPEITTIRLWVAPTQQAARRLYASLGFREVENPDRSALDGPGADEEIAMERAMREQDA